MNRLYVKIRHHVRGMHEISDMIQNGRLQPYCKAKRRLCCTRSNLTQWWHICVGVVFSSDPICQESSVFCVPNFRAIIAGSSSI